MSLTSPLWRCELLVTDRCNFNCPYCRGDKSAPDMTLDDAQHVVDLWASHNLRNVRFSGGEPTVWPHLQAIVRRAAGRGIERIAVSTNGSAEYEYYEDLLCGGVNDFSISLDACCASKGDKMAGGIRGAWERATDNTRRLAKLTYVTVGVVLTEDNIADCEDIIRFASEDLGVSDIRLITAAQWNENIPVPSVSINSLWRHPILHYRLNNIQIGRNVRGLTATDNPRCPLVCDDMAIKDGQHYPCIIYLRERGDAIGSINGKTIGGIREERVRWGATHDCFVDPICKMNCLDVCIDYNNRVRELKERR